MTNVSVTLHIPTFDELAYRERLMSDPATMAYNSGYDLHFDGYDRATGCIAFPREKWKDWYGYFVGQGPARYYAYITRIEDGSFVGEVNLHKSNRHDWYEMGVVVEADHRGHGYGLAALWQLLSIAFEQLGAAAVHNDFETERTAGLAMHLAAGFTVWHEADGVVEVLCTRAAYETARAETLINQIALEYTSLLRNNLVGVYLHGSLAFGCFRWSTSDIDFLVVTHHEPTLTQKAAMIETLMRLKGDAPTKGLEMSVLLAQDCLIPHHPVPFVLHYSVMHHAACERDLIAYCKRMHGEDPDLAAHLTVTRAVGKVVCGAPISAVFGNVPREAYLASILSDAADAETELFRQPVYYVLNLCRIWAFTAEGLILSKAQGGRWALEYVNATQAAVVEGAVRRYENGEPFHADMEAVSHCAHDLQQRIERLIKQSV